MSCNNNFTKISRTAGVKAGISAISSQATAAMAQTALRMRDKTGRVLDGVNRRVGRASAAAVKVIDSFETPQTIDSFTPVAAVAALVTNNNRTRLKILNSITALQLVRTLSTGAGTGAARLTRPRDEAIRTETFFDHRTPPVRIWRSGATTALNTRDIMRWPRTSVEFSSGQMMEARGKTWHLGTVVAAVGQAPETRTLTHLQSMNFPARHYYFNKPLSAREAAGIILDRPEYDPKHIEGFAGQVSEVESLHPSVSHLKHAMIQSGILWGDTAPILGPGAGGKAKLETAHRRQRQVSGKGYSPRHYDLEMAGPLSAQFAGRQCSETELRRVIGLLPGAGKSGEAQQAGQGRGGDDAYILAGQLGDVHYTRPAGAASTITIEAVVPRQGQARKLRGALQGIRQRGKDDHGMQ